MRFFRTDSFDNSKCNYRMFFVNGDYEEIAVIQAWSIADQDVKDFINTYSEFQEISIDKPFVYAVDYDFINGMVCSENEEIISKNADFYSDISIIQNHNDDHHIVCNSQYDDFYGSWTNFFNPYYQVVACDQAIAYIGFVNINDDNTDTIYIEAK